MSLGTKVVDNVISLRLLNVSVENCKYEQNWNYPFSFYSFNEEL